MLNQTSEYALRAMVYMTRLNEPGYAGVKDIAAATGVPANYLAKILQQLAKSGILKSQKGFGGGFRIAQQLDKINLQAIVGPLEDTSRFHRCVLGQRECNDELACPLHDAWKRIRNDYLGALENTTLQDIADFRRKADTIEGLAGEAPAAANAPDA